MVDNRVKRALSALTSTILEYLELDRNMAALQQNMMEFGPSDPNVRMEMMKMAKDRMVLNTRTTEKLKGLYYQRPSQYPIANSQDLEIARQRLNRSR